ncbi:transcription factor IIIA-like isoform X2 [Triticum dicoccoides]|uniref:C2H2-type domain-containing protein n=1 Tax=Triticum turgidum subsp. durum TaxID=4567 RepID=A0A9R0PZX9_TRITD|nr:transcription factor IIIA-like isoform X2 [Triticum dicoccoides]XP_037483215.1 transcription factor IIIA-like isoform X2 [Triticum dicoccoides]VAH01332.1 unnamed protein product [Triticum turgidum subsp. durum]
MFRYECVKHWIPRTPKCQKALNGPVSGRGDPPEKLHQECLIHALPQRPFACHVDGCPFSYSRKDHLNRHLLTHQGKLFMCPMEGCNRKFSIKGNIQRHVEEFHEDGPHCGGKKEFICPEANCGKAFKYASKLQKHEESHVNLDYTEVICFEPGCMKTFTNVECFKAHNQSCHQYVQCDICDTKQLKKNFKRHQRMHEGSFVTERIKCNFKDCKRSFSKKSNLHKHIKAVHEQSRPFTCGFSGCGQKFSYKHVRDNHEKSSVHVLFEGDFVEADEQLRPHPGGRKRKPISVDTFMRKRVAAPDAPPAYSDGTEYLRWLLSG